MSNSERSPAETGKRAQARERISVVLVEPQGPGNIGATARALQNMGLESLTLVRPVQFQVPEARRMATHALPLLEGARVVSSLEEGIAEAGLVVGTSRRAGKNRRPVVDVRLAARRAAEAALAGNRVALVFGREDKGLSTAEMGRCHLLARIPTAEENPSLNLAQAVLVTVYEIWRVWEMMEDPGGVASRDLAPARMTEEMFRDLTAVLLEIGFLNEQNPEEIVLALRRLLGRAEMERREVQILRGVFRQVRWAVDRGRGGSSEGE
jgi:tRNA/rRNA methyltransferase